MSKVNTMDQTIEELRDAAAAINSVADWLFQQFTGTDDETNAEEKPVFTLEQIRAVLADKSRAGHTAAIRDLLQKYGASKLSQVNPKNYETAKGNLDTLQADLSERKVKWERIDAFLKELERKKELVTEFDEGLWNTMVETMTVHSYDNIVFQFRDGTKVKWQIK